MLVLFSFGLFKIQIYIFLTLKLQVFVAMEKVFAIFHLIEAKKTVVGRVDWIYRLNLAKTLNNRINRNQTQTIFWSKDLKKNPSFKNSAELQFRSEFDENQDGIYRAKIKKCFGECLYVLVNVHR